LVVVVTEIVGKDFPARCVDAGRESQLVWCVTNRSINLNDVVLKANPLDFVHNETVKLGRDGFFWEALSEIPSARWRKN
jgi:hypothetical protein